MTAFPQRTRVLRPVALCVALALPACSPAPAGSDINDPYEAQNRAVHEENKRLDTAVFGGPGRESREPGPFVKGLANVGSNLKAPRNVVNGILQADPEIAVTNTFRFVINSTFGLAGLFDPATALGIPRKDTDFGATLARWGVPEGAYLELPVVGPSTERDAAGRIVDLALDPVYWYLGTPGAYGAFALQSASRIESRQRFAGTYESILYGSADSYAQARLLYLQSRRYELGQEEEVFDPYEDPYAQ
ncbi:MAG: VacJ family lipoprotein [Rhodobacteraceae bacterium]|nr:VacJ family lipoprotein [Paracoccaceae bacterium]